MEERLADGLIRMPIILIVVVAVCILYLYTMKKIKEQISISEFAQIQKAKDVDY
jgi:uncharacterized membrane protein